VLRAEAPEVSAALQFLAAAREQADDLADGVRLFDPVPMRLVRRARLERALLVVEADTRAPLQNLLNAWVPRLYALRAPRELRWHLDVDPLEL